MQFAAFADRAAELEGEPGYIETVALVADFLESADEDLAAVT